MPNQGLLRLRKLKVSDLAGAQRHNERRPGVPTSHSNPDIDPTKTSENLIWAGGFSSKKSYLDRCRCCIEGVDAERKRRGMRRMRHGDANWTVACEFVVAMADYMKRSSKKEQIRAMKKAATWLNRCFGEENVISIAAHFDEPGQPHMHFVFVPVHNKNLSVSASSLFTPKSLAKLQDLFYEHVFSKFGLDRHNSGSGRKHIETPEYKALCRDIDTLKEQRESATGELEKLKAEVLEASRGAFEKKAELQKIEEEIRKKKQELANLPDYASEWERLEEERKKLLTRRKYYLNYAEMLQKYETQVSQREAEAKQKIAAVDEELCEIERLAAECQIMKKEVAETHSWLLATTISTQDVSLPNQDQNEQQTSKKPLRFKFENKGPEMIVLTPEEEKAFEKPVKAKHQDVSFLTQEQKEQQETQEKEEPPEQEGQQVPPNF